MRKATLSDGQTMDVRGMTTHEIRGGKDLGLRYFGAPDIHERFEDTRDYCIRVIFGEDGLDLPNPDQNLLFSAILSETYGNPGEEKNLPTSGPGAQTGNA